MRQWKAGMEDRARALRALSGLMLLMALGWVASLAFPGALSWGILPRTLGGLFPGILVSPFLHGSWGHLAGNLWALAILGGLLASLEGESRFWRVTLASIAFGGALTWLIGSAGSHVGASGLVFAYFGYLAVRGFATGHPVMALASVGVAIAYGGSMLSGIFLAGSGVSWEAHLSGALAGGALAWTEGRTGRGRF